MSTKEFTESLCYFCRYPGKAAPFSLARIILVEQEWCPNCHPEAHAELEQKLLTEAFPTMSPAALAEMQAAFDKFITTPKKDK